MHRRGAAALLLAGTLLAGPFLAACGDDPAPGPGDSGSGSSGSTDGSDPTESSGGTSADPATGPELSAPHVTLNAPDGWKVDELTDQVLTAEPKDPGLISSITVTDQEVDGGAYPLDRLAQDAIELGGSQMQLAVQPTVEIAGEETYHVAGTFGASQAVDEFGPSVDGAVVSIEFQLSTVDSRKQRQALIDAVLASVEWNL